MPEKFDQDKIISAIEKTDHRITAADLVVATGMSYHEAVTELNKIAATKFGVISVNELGKVVYKFPHGLANHSLPGSSAVVEQARRVANNLWFWIYYLACLLLILSPLCFLGLALMFAPVAPRRREHGDQWVSIATFIRQKKGVVAIEELAPLASIDPSREEQMLPILIRFNGRPEVSPTGNIFYVFPDLIATTSKDSKMPRLPFSAAKKRWPVGDDLDTNFFWYFKVAALINLFVSFTFLTAFSGLGGHPAAILVRFWTTLSFVMTGVGLLRWYRFNAITRGIDQRKNSSEEYAHALANPAPSLVDKLREVNEHRHQRQGRHHKEIVYSTDSELLEQAREFQDDKKDHDQK